MKLNKSVFLAFVMLIVVGSVLRVAGYAPQIAMGIFGAAVISDKRLAFILPLLSMFLSDVLYEVLYRSGYMEYGGIYEGQLLNYLALAGITLLGFLARNLNWARIAAVTVAAPFVYFLVSNFMVWAGGGGLQRPKTFDGLMMCFNDGWPFFKSSLAHTLVFSAILFGGYYLIQRFVINRKELA
jgi:hypothetical protein